MSENNKKTFFDRLKENLSPFENEGTKKIDADAPLSEQIDNVGNIKPTILSTSPVYANQNGNVVQQGYIQIPQEIKTKWDNFIATVFASLNDPKPSYHEFINMSDAMGNALPDNVKFPTVFQGFKIQGLTRETLLETAKGSLLAIQKNAGEFKETMDAQVQKEVTARRDSIAKKMEQIQILQQEMAQLSTEADQQQAKIDTNIVAYNMVSKEYQDKISKDIQNIENFILTS